MTADFTIRASRADITPTPRYPLGGFASRTSPSAGVHRPLEAASAVLTQGGNRVVWISIDVLAITAPLRAVVVDTLVQRCGFAPDDIILVATHTHSAPAVWHGTIHPVLPAEFSETAVQEVAERIATSILSAPEYSASARFGLTTVEGVGSNRHRPDGPVDKSIGVLVISAAESRKPVALVCDYACHPTVLGEQNTLYSPDWVGGARDRIRALLGAELPVLYLPGAGGDVSTRFLRRDRTAAEALRLGSLVGDAALAAVRTAEIIEPISVSLHRRALHAPTRTSFDDILSAGAADLGETSARLAASMKEGADSRTAFRNARVASELEIPLSLVRVGPRTWFHTPFEVGTELAGRTIADTHTTRFIGYSDGYAGYLADAVSASAGHYEASASYFDVATTEYIVTHMSEVRAGMSTASS